MEYFEQAKDFYEKAVKAVSKTDSEKKLAEALSKDNWGASSTLLREIAQLTFDWQEYGVVMRELWASLSKSPKNWRQIFKGLTLLEYLIKNGTDRVVEDARDHVHQVKSLTSFSFFVDGVEKGTGVKEKAKQIVELLGDNELIREEREKANALKDKYTGIGRDGGSTRTGGYDSGGLGSSRFGGSGGRYGDERKNSRDRVPSSGGGRYSDDKPWDKSFGGSSSKSRNDSEDEPAPRRRRNKEKKDKSKKSSKKSTSSASQDEFGDFSQAKPAAQEEVDLFGATTDTAPATQEVFDPFGSGPATSQQQSSVSNDTQWNAFESSTPAAVSSTTGGNFGQFDAFQSAPSVPAPVVPPQQPDFFGNFQAPPTSNPAPVSSSVDFFSSAPQPNGMQGFPSQPVAQQQPIQSAQANQADLMGGFQSAPVTSTPAAPSSQTSSSSLLTSGIVDLDNLSLNSSKPKTAPKQTVPGSQQQPMMGNVQQQKPMMGNMQQQQPMMGNMQQQQQPMMGNMQHQQPMMMGNMQHQQPMMGGNMQQQQPMMGNMQQQQPMMGNMQQQQPMMMGNMQQQQPMMGNMQQQPMMGNMQQQPMMGNSQQNSAQFQQQQPSLF